MKHNVRNRSLNYVNLYLQQLRVILGLTEHLWNSWDIVICQTPVKSLMFVSMNCKYSVFIYEVQFLNNIRINKTKVLLPQSLVTLADFGFPV